MRLAYAQSTSVEKDIRQQLLDLGINESAWHFLLFKSVNKSDSTYLMNSSSLREQWQKVVDALPLEAKNGNGKVTKLEEVVMSHWRKKTQL